MGTGYQISDDQQVVQEAASFGVIAVIPDTDVVEVIAAEQAPTSANWIVDAYAVCATAP